MVYVRPSVRGMSFPRPQGNRYILCIATTGCEYGLDISISLLLSNFDLGKLRFKVYRVLHSCDYDDRTYINGHISISNNHLLVYLFCVFFEQFGILFIYRILLPKCVDNIDDMIFQICNVNVT